MERDQSLSQAMKERFTDAIIQTPQTSDMLTFHVAEDRLKEVIKFLKTEATPKYLRLDDLTAIDESARRGPQPSQPTREPWAMRFRGVNQTVQCEKLIQIILWSTISSPSTLPPVSA